MSEPPTREQLDELGLTDDQLQGAVCIWCGQTEPYWPMRAVATPDNPKSTHVFEHIGACPERQEN